MNKKKLIFVSARLPFPPKEGHQLRSFGLLKELSKYYDVHLLTILRPGERIESNELTELCKSVTGSEISFGIKKNLETGIYALIKNLPLVVPRYSNKGLKLALSNLIKDIKPDIIHLDLLPLMGLNEVIPKNLTIILNEHNVESELIRQKNQLTSSPIMKLVYKREYKLLDRFEKIACMNVNHVLACSDDDKRIIESFGAKSVHNIPNGVDIEQFPIQKNNSKTKDLVFLGGMGWYPNKIGMEWFIKHVLPLIVNSKPDVVVNIIGNPKPALNIPSNLTKHVIIHGFVDDFKPLVSEALLMIVPITVGSGTRLKIIEGAALGKCIVSTSKGAEGVILKNNEEIIIEDQPEDFAARILQCMDEPQRVVAIGKKARAVIEATYDWKIIGKKLHFIYSGNDESK